MGTEETPPGLGPLVERNSNKPSASFSVMWMQFVFVQLGMDLDVI